jgi:hypothetical protein
VAHLSASFAGREKDGLYYAEEAKTKDGFTLKMNMSHAIMIKSTEENQKLVELLKLAKDEELVAVPFTEEMIEASDDQKVIDEMREKNLSDLNILGVLVYGKKKAVEQLTEKFELWK